MLLWGKMTDQYNQNTLGFSTNSDINRAFFGNRPGWSQPHLVTYAESHDEERLMYKNLTFGNSANASHDVKQLSISLARMEAMQPFLFLIPGPKMIWQFGELGYDKSIFMCENGTIPQPYGNDNCKTNPKPVLWNYNTEPARKKIYNVIAGLNRIRALKPNAFLTNSISGNLGNDYKKQLIINHPDLKLVAISNFDIIAQNFTVTFPSSGTWYEYFTNTTFTATGGGQTINMQAAEYRVYTNISFCTTAAPTATTSINYCQNATATALTASGTNLLWYTTSTGGTGSSTAPTPVTTAVGSIIYYVSQTINGCEGPRTSITVNVTAPPAAPTVVTPILYCQNTTAVALTASGTNLLWYLTATGGTGSSTPPVPSTTTIGSTNYYVSQSNASGCQSSRSIIVVNITASTPAPTVTTPVTYCQNATATALTATGTNLLWYTNSTSGTGSSIAPTPSTTTAGTAIFYVSQTQSCGESPRAAITVNVNAIPAAPAVTSTINYCQNATATGLTATGNNLLWYTLATGGTGSATAPTPSTLTVGSTTFFVSQSAAGGCESQRAAITVNISAIPAAPTAASPVTYCQNATATALTATGSNLLWYAVATGGTGSTNTPIPSTTTIGSTNFYVSQSANSCESPRTLITVIITATTAAPTVTSPVNYCQNAIAVALTATGTNLLWYTNPTGGIGSTTSPTPLTTTAGTAIFYVSQTQSCGESPRAAITVNVNTIPAAPAVTSTISYCQNATAISLTATGNNLLWYTVATGGTGSATAPTPSTTTVGSTTFFVSQSAAGGCQSARAAITVNVNITPVAPTVIGNVNYCQNAPATALTAGGSNFLWYTVATGGTGSATAPTPITTTAGTTTFYVSQTQGTCESPRSAITVTVTALPTAPVVVSSVTYCQNAAATALSATGTNLLWYTTVTGGTASSTAPIPNTTVAGNFNFYVAQTNSCGEGARANIQVIITATPAAPITLSTTAITLNSATLNWNAQSGLFFTVEYKLATATTWIVAAAGLQTNTYDLSGLTIGSTYQWRITSNCVATGLGNVSAVQTFTTASRNNRIAIIKDGIGLKITPNPVSTTAIIDYIVPGSGEVTFNILNQNGSSVKKFSDGLKVPGQYQKNIVNEFKGLARGSYFIRVEQSNKSIGLHFVKF